MLDHSSTFRRQPLSRQEEEAMATRMARVDSITRNRMINRGLAVIIRRRMSEQVAKRFEEARNYLLQGGNPGWYFSSLCDAVVREAIRTAPALPQAWWFGRLASFQPGWVQAVADLHGLRGMTAQYILAGLKAQTPS